MKIKTAAGLFLTLIFYTTLGTDRIDNITITNNTRDEYDIFHVLPGAICGRLTEGSVAPFSRVAVLLPKDPQLRLQLFCAATFEYLNIARDTPGGSTVIID